MAPGLSQPLGWRLVGGKGAHLAQAQGKDTGLNVGSHDVTCDVEVDADEFALPTGKHSSGFAAQLQPLTPGCGQAGGRCYRGWGRGGIPVNTQNPTGQLIKQNQHLLS